MFYTQVILGHIFWILDAYFWTIDKRTQFKQILRRHKYLVLLCP